MTYQDNKLSLSANDDPSRKSEQITGVVIGSTINDRYVILSLIGQGGMGIAYKAMDNQLKQPVVLKFLLPHRFANISDLSRFEREAKTASRLSHSNIVKVFDFAVLTHEQPYLVMEFLDGRTLAQRIEAEGQLPVDETIDIFVQICDALAYAHSMGILHRDIKPSNIMLTVDSGRVRAKLLDFGMAKFIDGEETQTQTITQTNELVGSPFYMSPEQARNSALDARSDLYSLGCTIYEALTGGPPHLGQTSIATLLKRETDQPLALSEASLGRHFSELLEHLVSRLLKTNPDDRFQSAQEVMEELKRIRSGDLQTTTLTSQNAPIKAGNARPQHSVRYLLLSLGCIAVLFFLMKTLSRPSQPEQTVTGMKAKEAPVTQYFNQMDIGPIADRFEESRLNNIAYLHLGKNQLPEALSVFKECIVACERDPRCSKDKYANSLSGLASTYYLMGDYDQSTKALKRAVGVYEEADGKESPALALALTSLGCSFLQLGKDANHEFQTAKPLFERSISIQAKLSDQSSSGLTNLLIRQATYCSDTGLLTEASWRFEKAVELFHASPGISDDPYPLTQALVSLVALNQRRQQYDRIPPLCHELALRFNKLSPSEKATMATHLIATADMLRTNANKTQNPLNAFYQSQLAYEAALSVYEPRRAIHPEGVAGIYEHLAFVCKMQGKLDDLEKANHWLRQSDLLRRRVTPPQDYIDKTAIHALEEHYTEGDLHKMADDFLANGNLSEALSTYKECAAIYERDPQCRKDKYAEVLSGLSYTYFLLGESAQSANALKRSVSVYEEAYGKDSSGMAFILTSIGCGFMWKVKDPNRAFQAAQPLFERSLSIRAKIPGQGHCDFASLMDEQGIACLARGLVSEARWRLEKAATIFRAYRSPTPESLHFFARTLSELVELYRRTGQYDRIPAVCGELAAILPELNPEYKKAIAHQVVHAADIGHSCANKVSDRQNALRQTERLYELVLPIYRSTPDSSGDLAQLYKHLDMVCKAQGKHLQIPNAKSTTAGPSQ
jgi:tetratricopeptide (TPR) repeat protein/tRNA A-37 threonylcarbamoyl transferase component Bud32